MSLGTPSLLWPLHLAAADDVGAASLLKLRLSSKRCLPTPAPAGRSDRCIDRCEDHGETRLPCPVRHTRCTAQAKARRRCPPARPERLGLVWGTHACVCRNKRYRSGSVSARSMSTSHPRHPDSCNPRHHDLARGIKHDKTPAVLTDTTRCRACLSSGGSLPALRNSNRSPCHLPTCRRICVRLGTEVRPMPTRTGRLQIPARPPITLWVPRSASQKHFIFCVHSAPALAIRLRRQGL